MSFVLFPHATAEIIGITGFALYVTTYTLLTLRIISGNSVKYFCMNLCSSSFVLIGLTSSFNLASALIQTFWISMSLIGIAIRLMRPTVPQIPHANVGT